MAWMADILQKRPINKSDANANDTRNAMLSPMIDYWRTMNFRWFFKALHLSYSREVIVIAYA